MKSFRACHQAGGAQFHGLNRKCAEMFLDPRPPHEFGMIAGLQHWLHALGTAAPDKPEMAAMRAGHRLDNNACLSVLPCAEDKAVIPPFHTGCVPRLRLSNIEHYKEGLMIY